MVCQPSGGWDFGLRQPTDCAERTPDSLRRALRGLRGRQSLASWYDLGTISRGRESLHSRRAHAVTSAVASGVRRRDVDRLERLVRVLFIPASSSTSSPSPSPSPSPSHRLMQLVRVQRTCLGGHVHSG